MTDKILTSETREVTLQERLRLTSDNISKWGDISQSIMLDAVERIDHLEKERARVLAIVSYHTSEEKFAEPSEKVLNQLFDMLKEKSVG